MYYEADLVRFLLIFIKDIWVYYLITSRNIERVYYGEAIKKI